MAKTFEDLMAGKHGEWSVEDIKKLPQSEKLKYFQQVIAPKTTAPNLHPFDVSDPNTFDFNTMKYKGVQQLAKEGIITGEEEVIGATKPDLIYNGKIIKPTDSKYDMYAKYGAKEAPKDKGYETGTSGTALGNLIMEQYHNNPNAKANEAFVQGVAKHLYDRPATKEEIQGLVGKTLTEVLKTSGSIGGYDGMTEGWTSLLGGEKGVQTPGTPGVEVGGAKNSDGLTLEEANDPKYWKDGKYIGVDQTNTDTDKKENYLYIKDGKYFDQDGNWIKSMKGEGGVEDLVFKKGYKDYGKTGAPSDSDTADVTTKAKGDVAPPSGEQAGPLDTSPTASTGNELADAGAGTPEEILANEIATSIATAGGSGTNDEIMAIYNQMLESDINPYYKQLIAQAQGDLVTGVNRMLEDRVRQLQTENFQAFENVRETQANLESRGLTYSGEGIRELGALGAFGQELTPAQRAVEGKVPMVNRLISESSRAAFERNLQDMGTGFVRTAGTSGLEGLGLPKEVTTQQQTTGTLETGLTATKDVAFQAAKGNVQAQQDLNNLFIQ